MQMPAGVCMFHWGVGKAVSQPKDGVRAGRGEQAGSSWLPSVVGPRAQCGQEEKGKVWGKPPQPGQEPVYVGVVGVRGQGEGRGPDCGIEDPSRPLALPVPQVPGPLGLAFPERLLCPPTPRLSGSVNAATHSSCASGLSLLETERERSDSGIRRGRGWGEAGRAGTEREGRAGAGKGGVQRRGEGRRSFKPIGPWLGLPWVHRVVCSVASLLVPQPWSPSKGLRLGTGPSPSHRPAPGCRWRN